MTNIKRKFYLFEEVSESSIRTLVKDISETLEHDDQQERILKEYIREPIHLVIDSYGGSCYDGLALINLLRTTSTPIYTYSYGKAASMGFTLFLLGEKRFATEDTTFMYHQLSGGAIGKFESIKNSIEQTVVLHNTITKFIKSKLGKKARKKIDKSNNKQLDWYLSGKKAHKLGIVTELLNKKGNV